MPRKIRNCHRGFSLLEVLVVIAIIMVAAALMFTAFGQAKGKSLETVSKSNLRQYHVALHLYANDHGAMPIGRPYHPELTRYLGGKWIEPPLAKPMEQRSFRFDTTYSVHAYRDSYGFPQILRDCFDKRAGQISIVHDPNWATAEQIALTKGGFYLYIRMDGSIGKEPADIVFRITQFPDQYPCPGSPHWANFR